ncbi:hypothetical protein AWC38_SpisGene21927 [Stylophora pistillata]|uniref:HECT domain-containing protein n=1 Tax=Stylophora pistillata TaxID=50429 RepID=A0A2B4R6H8_STYPI|nr:hypothetical protein AWC38_SpisGene21927 [Stylophora pistillata]
MADRRGIADVARLLSQAATNLISLAPQSSQELRETNTTSDRAQAELKRAFSPYQKVHNAPSPVVSNTTARGTSSQAKHFTVTRAAKGRKKKTKELTAKLFCLAYTAQDEVPSTEEKRELLTAGLGEKKGFLPENSSAGELHEMVQATFPKLYEAGGYEFLHAEPSSRRLKAIAPGPNGYTMEYLKQFVGQGRIHVRPIQSNLDIDDVVIPAKMSVSDDFCQQCYKFFPMNELRQHLDVCVPFDAQPGEIERVPYIRHDFNRIMFEAVAKIIVKGYKDCQYFPVKISKSFLVACLFGEESVTDVMLMSSFQNYVSRSEADAIGKCLNQSIEPNDDELLEFHYTFDCKRRVTNDNIREVVTEFAHKEILMKPQYAADCWKEIVSSLKIYFTDVSSFLLLYDSIIPTNSKVISLFTAAPVTAAESETLGHLKRFVRGLDEAKLATFLRYTTASDVLVTDIITISFTNQEGLQRRPVAHTCSFTLEMPSTYSSFCELRQEFMAILNSDVWEIDIV